MTRPLLIRRAAAAIVLALALVVLPAALPSADAPLVSAVDTIGLTVSDLDRAVRFYTDVLDFRRESDFELEGRPFELLSGVFGARARVARLRLGEERLELTEYLAPRGRPMPDDVRANDRVFQHAAVIVSDMDQAYRRLRAAGVEHASTGPQRLPDWNPNAGGISAFYFRDPDRHYLEILAFPPGKGLPTWQAKDRLFLGIDHTAIVVADTDRSLRLYRDRLGLRVAGQSENYDVEQEHLNNVFGARLRITALRAASGPGIELLEYLAPGDGRPAPADLHANDVAHWQTTLIAADPSAARTFYADRVFTYVSPGAIELPASPIGYRVATLVRDPDGHGIRLAAPDAPSGGRR